jgi:hypothetical protein
MRSGTESTTKEIERIENTGDDTNMSDDKIQTYSREELNAMDRMQLRRIAVLTYKMNNTEVSRMKSDELKDKITELQKKTDKKPKAPAAEASEAPRPRGRPRKIQVEETPPEETPPEGTLQDEQPASDEELRRLDAIGKEFDAFQEHVSKTLEKIEQDLNDIQRGNFVLMGLLSDTWRNYFEPDELEGRIEALQKQFEEEGEGND